VDLPDNSLAAGMHRLIGGYSKRYNERHQRAGYLVRNRYWSRRKETRDSVLEAFRYVARNPVAAGLVQRPEDWRWCSYAKTIGVSQTFGFVDAADVLAEFGTTPIAQIRGLRRFVDS
jgi:putative transposase